MKIACTGFVSESAGSIASANALLLRAMLERGHEVTFFSKAPFVDPRPAARGHAGFSFVDVDNRLFDRARAAVSRVPLVNAAARVADSASYNRLLVREMTRAHGGKQFDLCLWLGDYARGRIAGVPNVSFVQGAPGSDARSIIRRFDEIKRLAGARRAWKWRALAALRLSPAALPPFALSDHFILGSRQSQRALREHFGVPAEKIHPLPYPIDLDLFDVGPANPGPALSCLWLGRIIPRKRLDLFLDGAAAAIRAGLDLRLTIAGGIGFIPGYEKLIAAFPFPDRLTWHRFVPRERVPALMRSHDVLVQPSEEEDFGSSAAEAQACGLPVVVGPTNGNADYLCPRDIHLRDDDISTLAATYADMAQRRGNATWGEPRVSREHAVKTFAAARVAEKFLAVLEKTDR